ncbi:MAG: tRNA (guanosine(37)-N1)-methyltransferase TrmD [Peptococcaceae bacterium]|jgi:tRNA (guanine37-N1)-methyltransferase|nr:tRNA (guanosine(37)-N1)-methyltransferase TrmD [Peptococcaceae bacterium]
MRIDILTLFPAMFDGPLRVGAVARATERGLVTVDTLNIRDFSGNRHHTVDDKPFGGGAGMVMQAGPVLRAVEHVSRGEKVRPRVCLTSPQGMRFNQSLARSLAGEEHLVLICGHYEGIDERVAEILEPDEIGIGDFVLSGGELAALVVIDAVVRLVPGVLRAGAAAEESFEEGLLEYPQYTHPREWDGHAVPEVLVSGHHGEVERWRRRQRLLRTLGRRPDLLAAGGLRPGDAEILRDLRTELERLSLD